MKKFSELGVSLIDNRCVFQVPKVSITDVLNCEIEVLDFESGVRTQHGEDRYVVKIRHDGIECKFFTNSTPIKEALHQINKDDFPFTTTIRVQKFDTGSGKTYHFT